MTYYQDPTVAIHHGDCLDVLRTLPDASVDAVVTDPPYGLEFMGKAWDSFGRDTGNGYRESPRINDRSGEGFPGHRGQAVNSFQAGAPFQHWCEAWATECLRVLKPGGHMLAFGGTRTWHRLAAAIEDAGFEIRDSIAWLYGSGFPKSLDVSKAIDKAAGVEREVIGTATYADGAPTRTRTGTDLGSMNDDGWQPVAVRSITAPATPDAERWQGWGTALKPAFEPIVVARKPLAGTVASNVLAHGTGALNVDGCRVAGPKPDATRGASVNASSMAGPLGGQGRILDDGRGRWPANVVLDESQAEALDQQSGELVNGGQNSSGTRPGDVFSDLARPASSHAGDRGGASRFFYVAREPAYPEMCVCDQDILNAVGCMCRPTPLPIDTLTSRFTYTAKAATDERVRVAGVAHPTVKPLALMRWLVRLVTPPGGTILEPFAGSGTTVEACILEGFRCVAIEREAEYLPLIRQRIHRRRDPVEAVKGSGEDGGLFDLLGEVGA